MRESSPPETATSTCPRIRLFLAENMAESADAHAASVMKFGPLKLNTLAILPEAILGREPGIVSSVMGRRLSLSFFRVCS